MLVSGKHVCHVSGAQHGMVRPPRRTNRLSSNCTVHCSLFTVHCSLYVLPRLVRALVLQAGAECGRARRVGGTHRVRWVALAVRLDVGAPPQDVPVDLL